MNKRKIICLNKSWDILHFKQVASTMDEIKKDDFLDYRNLIIYADIQTKGRGRNHKEWVSEKGNLFMSMKLSKPKIKEIFILNYLAGLTIYDCIRNFLLYDENIYIKWPNDILINDKKLAGILIELSSIGNKIETIYLGIGLNILSSPEGLNYNTTFLKEFETSNFNILAAIENIIETYTIWENKYCKMGPNHIIKEWMCRSYAIGKTIKFVSNSNLVKGSFQGIDTDGALKIRVDKKMLKFYNKEILI